MGNVDTATAALDAAIEAKLITVNENLSSIYRLGMAKACLLNVHPAPLMNALLEKLKRFGEAEEPDVRDVKPSPTKTKTKRTATKGRVDHLMDRVEAKVTAKAKRGSATDPDTVEAIRRAIFGGDMTQREVAATYGVSRGTVYNIMHGKKGFAR